LLDEATSALDSENEKIVQESLDRIMKGKTTLVIAHRISTIKDSNVIVVMEEGEIVEAGDFQTLMDKKGYFYRLERGEVK
jgi:ATP-binding cassette subfamily B (MDR/TAP) protein 1